MKRLRSRLATDRGITIVELSVSLFVSAIIISVMLAWIVGVAQTEDIHQSDDIATQDLRVAKELLTRDIRSAEYLTAASVTSLTMWVDGNRDDVQDLGELVTWSMSEDDGLVRADDDGASNSQVPSLSVAGSGFTYDSATPGDVTVVGFVLVGEVETPGGVQTRSISTEIHLRNA